MNAEKPNKIDLRTIFLGLQDLMIASLSATREIIQHPGTKGDASGLHWLNMLSTHLPERYRVDKAFVLDCDGNISDQIDVVIYDRQYSPFLFNQNNDEVCASRECLCGFRSQARIECGQH